MEVIFFSEHAWPDTFAPDKGPCSAASSSKQWEEMVAHHITHLPHHYQSDSLVEKCIQLVKSWLSKAKEIGPHPHLAMVLCRKIPLTVNLQSLMELMNGQKPAQRYQCVMMLE